MSATQHTPGPWVQGTKNGACMANIYSGKSLCLATVSVFGSPIEQDANARLIAAAPDLLAFAESVAALGRLSHANMRAEEFAVMVDSARAAIARATGSDFVDHRSPEELAASYPRMSVWSEGEGAK